MILIVGSTLFLDTLTLYLLVPLGPEIAAEARVEGWVLGLLWACYGLAAVVATMMVPTLCKRRSLPRLVAMGMALLAVGVVVTGWAMDPVALGVGRVLHGLGSGLSFAAGASWMARVAPKDQRGRVLALMTAIPSAGMLIGPPLAGWTAPFVERWLLFLPFACFALVIAVIALRSGAGCTRTLLAHQRPPHPHQLLLLVTLVAVEIMVGCWELALPFVLRGQHGLSTSSVGGLFGGWALMVVVCGLLCGLAVDRVGWRPVLAVGLLALIACGFLLAVSHALALVIAGLVVLGIGWVAAQAALLPGILEHSGEQVERGMSLAALATLVGFSLGPLAGGLAVALGAGAVALSSSLLIATLLVFNARVPTSPGAR